MVYSTIGLCIRGITLMLDIDSFVDFSCSFININVAVFCTDVQHIWF